MLQVRRYAGIVAPGTAAVDREKVSVLNAVCKIKIKRAPNKYMVLQRAVSMKYFIVRHYVRNCRVTPKERTTASKRSRLSVSYPKCMKLCISINEFIAYLAVAIK